jgi:hypothetical protein
MMSRALGSVLHSPERGFLVHSPSWSFHERHRGRLLMPLILLASAIDITVTKSHRLVVAHAPFRYWRGETARDMMKKLAI